MIPSEAGILERRADAALVVGGVEIEHEVQVAGRARLSVHGKRPRARNVVADAHGLEAIEDVALDAHPNRIRRRSVVGGVPWPMTDSRWRR